MISKDDAEATKDNVARAGRDAAGEARRAFEAAPDAANDLYGQARDKAQGVTQGLAGSLPSSASEALEAGQHALRTGGEQVARRVTERPVEALMLAGAIGYLVGWAVSRA